MKKILSIAILMAFAAMVTSCSSSSDTPTAVAEKLIELMKAKDYEKVADYMYVKPGTSAEEEEQGKAMIVGLMQNKASKDIDSKGGIDSYETISETISESGEKAVVVINVIYGDGSSKEQKTKTIKGEDGKWYLDMSK